MEEPGMMALARASHTGTAGKNFKTDYKQQWYGIYLAAEVLLGIQECIH
ncbi:hypothetical protein [Metabacillus niabensis]|nr:hypothetical protein [Metabacillus niabensis]